LVVDLTRAFLFMIARQWFGACIVHSRRSFDATHMRIQLRDFRRINWQNC